MTAAKHTPGPWLAAGKHITQDDGSVIAYTTAYAKPTPRQLADARLIAAAPEMLEVLQLILQWDDAGLAQTEGLMQKARAAIAKATGGAS